MKSTRVQLIIHSARHGTNLTSIELDKVSIFFKPQVRQNTKKLGVVFEKNKLYSITASQKGKPESH